MVSVLESRSCRKGVTGGIGIAVPRKARVEFPGAIYHVRDRGIGGKLFFETMRVGSAFQRPWVKCARALADACTPSCRWADGVSFRISLILQTPFQLSGPTGRTAPFAPHDLPSSHASIAALRRSKRWALPSGGGG